MNKQSIVIIGGGFAGVKCAQTLASELRDDECLITLFSEENHMIFHPLLAEVAAAKVQFGDMAVVLRELFKNVRCRTERVLSINFSDKKILYLAEDGRETEMPYDHIVIACGNTANLSIIPGMADHGFPLKTVYDALILRQHVINQMEKAETCIDSERKAQYLTFVIVGGGFSGIELAGELNDLVKTSSKLYKNFQPSDVKVSVVHSSDEILLEVSKSLRGFAKREMEKRGVEFILNSRVKMCSKQSLVLDDGTSLKAGTIVCTIGSQMLPLLKRLDVKKEHGRIVTAPDMSVPDKSNVWAIGDCAAIFNAVDNSIATTTAQFAEREGAQAARNIIARLNGRETEAFAHKSLGTMCSLGGRSAVAEIMGIRITGRLAWLVWRSVYLLKLPSLGQKVKVGVAWIFESFLKPNVTSFRVNKERSMSRAHYAAGDTIYSAGEPATDFFVIDQGKVQVTENDGNMISLLGPGDFFGHEVIFGMNERTQSCQAIEESEISVLGKSIFADLVSLSPLQTALIEGLKRRNPRLDSLGEKLAEQCSIKIADLLEPADGLLISPEDRLQDIVLRMNTRKFEMLFVVGKDLQLLGLLSRTDLMTAIDVAVSMPKNDRLDLLVSSVMNKSPQVVSLENSSDEALLAMREHNFSRMPVVNSVYDRTLAGFLRIERILSSLIEDEKGLA